MVQHKKIQIAEMLVENGLISQSQMRQAFEIQKNSNKKIGQILVELGFVDEEKLFYLLSEQLGVPFIPLDDYHFDNSLVKLLPEFYARHFRSIVLKRLDNALLVGMVDPQNLVAKDEIERILGQKISLALIKESDLLKVFDNVYRRSEEISQHAETLQAELNPKNNGLMSKVQDFSSEDLPVVNLLRSIFEDAVQVNASDIHIEPDDKILRIRLRVDGVLQEQILHERNVVDALVQRIKLISGLNIAEKRLPQDGRFTMTIRNKHYDIRVSTIPTQYGESLVMRLLNQSDALLNINEIGMPKEILANFKQSLTQSYGLILIVGPTGSGKTTTLYSALNLLNNSEDKIITVEDPIEYRLSRVNQVQVNTKINLSFANVLRSILRQDPDIIMVGELRDEETVDIALRAAMTGHLVLATLHTNDTISAPYRLLDMGAKKYLLASVLRTVLAQRLVRKICLKCICDASLDDAEISWLKSYEPNLLSNTIFKHGTGCSNCHNTGYKGRHGVYELLPLNETLADALRDSDVTEFNKIAKKQSLYRPLALAGIDLAVKGITTVKEVIHMAGEI